MGSQNVRLFVCKEGRQGRGQIYVCTATVIVILQHNGAADYGGGGAGQGARGGKGPAGPRHAGEPVREESGRTLHQEIVDLRKAFDQVILFD